MVFPSVRSLRNTAAVIGRSLRYGGLDAIREFYTRTVNRYRGRLPADPVLDAEWEVLVVLDACRADLFQSTVESGSYANIPAGEVRTSPASSSKEWLAAVFEAAPEAALKRLAYVTGNPYAAELDAGDFGCIDHVWRDGWDDRLGTIPPEPITDRAITRWRRGSFDRMVVHYMQPHFPSVVTGVDDGVPLDAFGEESMSIWEELRFGHRSVESAWSAYRANLKYVLDEVESLLVNLDADPVVITADHGNAFGEGHLWGHPEGVHLPCLREVPWSVTAGVDTETRSSGVDDPTTEITESAVVDERLSQLGYRP